MRFDKIEFVAAFGTSEQIPPSREAEIVFSGRSNVGKSSAINRLFNRKNIARISSTPGKTTTIIFFKSEDVFFVDLPGYGYAKRGKSEKRRWSKLVDEYFNSGRNVALVIQLIDMRRAPTEDDELMLNFIKEKEIPFVVALTKSDKLNKTETEKRRKEIKTEFADYPGVKIIEFSAAKGTGVNETRAEIKAALSAGRKN